MKVSRRDFLRIGMGLAVSGFSSITDAMEKYIRYTSSDYKSYRQIHDTSLDDIMHEVTVNGLSNDLTHLDVLLRIGQDVAEHGAALEFSVKDANRIKKEMYCAANELAERFAKIQTVAARAPTTREYIREINRTLYRINKFEFPNDYRPNTDVHTRNIVEAWQSKKGVCEDMVGIYMSLVDILNHGNLDLNTSTIILPGHILITWDHGNYLVELNDSGSIKSRDFYNEIADIKMYAGAYYKPNKFGAIANELNNSAAALHSSNPDQAIKYISWAIKLTPGISYMYYNLANIRLRSYKQKNDLKSAIIHVDKAIALDPEARINYLLKSSIYESISQSNNNLDEKLENMDKAELQIDKAFSVRNAKRAIADISVTSNNNLRIAKTEFLKRRFLLSKDTTDLKKAIRILDQHMPLDLESETRKGKIYTLWYKVTGDKTKYALALENYNAAINRQSDWLHFENYTLRGYLHLIADNYQSSIADYEKALKLGSSMGKLQIHQYGQLFIGSGLGYIGLGNMESANTCFKKAINQNDYKNYHSIKQLMQKESKKINGWHYLYEPLFEKLLENHSAVKVFEENLRN